MGENYEYQLRLFAGGKPVATSAEAMMTSLTPSEIGTPLPDGPLKCEWSGDVRVSGLLDAVKEQLGMKSRVFSRSERRLFIRTVEHHGRVDFTLKDWQGHVEGLGCGDITIMCSTPGMVRRFLRMRGFGNVSYRIMTRAAAEPQHTEKRDDKKT